jgi:hypothetical protein
MTSQQTDQAARVTATETFAAEIDGRIFYVRTGDRLSATHGVVVAHPTRFDHGE